MPTSLRDSIRSQLDWARMCTTNLLDGFPEDKATFVTGKHDLHATWILGHLACTEHWILGMLEPGGGQKDVYPQDWTDRNLFGYGSKIQPPEEYPSFAETRGAFDDMHALLVGWVDNADDAALSASLDDGGSGFAKTPAEAISRMAWHEGWHAGQLSTLRRALGLPSSF